PDSVLPLECPLALACPLVLEYRLALECRLALAHWCQLAPRWEWVTALASTFRSERQLKFQSGSKSRFPLATRSPSPSAPLLEVPLVSPSGSKFLLAYRSESQSVCPLACWWATRLA